MARVHDKAITRVVGRGGEAPLVEDTHVGPKTHNHVVFLAGSLHVLVDELPALPDLEVVGQHEEPCEGLGFRV